MLAFFRLLKFLWDNRSSLMDLLEALPPALENAGIAMETAGGAAVGASQLIRSTASAGQNAEDLFNTGSEVFEDIQEQFNFVKGQVDTIRKNPLFGPIGILFDLKTPLDEVHGELDAITQKLQSAATTFDYVSNVMNNTGDKLHDIGEGLSEAGGLLKSVQIG